jgi:hypothetical protein
MVIKNQHISDKMLISEIKINKAQTIEKGINNHNLDLYNYLLLLFLHSLDLLKLIRRMNFEIDWEVEIEIKSEIKPQKIILLKSNLEIEQRSWIDTCCSQKAVVSWNRTQKVPPEAKTAKGDVGGRRCELESNSVSSARDEDDGGRRCEISFSCYFFVLLKRKIKWK